MFIWQKINVRIVLFVGAFVAVAFAFVGWSNAGAQNSGDSRMKDPNNMSARDMWSSIEEIDALIDTLKGAIIAQGANEQALDPMETYRQQLHDSFLTGGPMPKSELQFTSFSTPGELMEDLAEKGIDAESLGIDRETLEAKFKEFRESRESD